MNLSWTTDLKSQVIVMKTELNPPQKTEQQCFFKLFFNQWNISAFIKIDKTGLKAKGSQQRDDSSARRQLQERIIAVLRSWLWRKPHGPWKQSCFTHIQNYRYGKRINQEAGHFNSLEPFLLIHSNFLCVKILMHEQLLISNIITSQLFVCVYVLISLYD